MKRQLFLIGLALSTIFGCAPQRVETGRQAKLRVGATQYAEIPADHNGDGMVNAGDILVIRQGANWNLPVDPNWVITYEQPVDPDPPTELPPQTDHHGGLKLGHGTRLANLRILPGAGNPGLAAMVSDTSDCEINNVTIQGGDHGIVNWWTPDMKSCLHAGLTLDHVDVIDNTNKGGFVGVDGLTMRHCNWTDTDSHTLRLWAVRNGLIEDCTFAPRKGRTNAACLKIHCDTKSGWVASEDLIVRRTVVRPTAMYAITVGTQDGGKNELTRRVLLEDVTVDFQNSPAGYALGIFANGQEITMRRCKGINMGPEHYLIAVNKWGIGPAPTGCVIEDCTADNGKVVHKVWGDTVVR